MRFYHRIFCLFLSFALCLSGFHPGVLAQEKEISVLLDGVPIVFDTTPVIEGDRTLVPVRAIFEKLGYQVVWIADTQQIIATGPEGEIRMAIDDPVAVVNGDTASLDVPPRLFEGRTMVPLRFIGEASNCDVLWDGAAQTVYLESRPAYDIASQKQSQNIAVCAGYYYWSDASGSYRTSLDGLETERLGQTLSSLQQYSGYLFGRNSSFQLCRISPATQEITAVAEEPISNFMIYNDRIYYSIMYDTTHALYCMNLAGTDRQKVIDEPCGDYAILNDAIYYIHLHSKNLICKPFDGEAFVIYDDYTTSFDVSGNSVYYSAAMYKDERYPLEYRGIMRYDPENGTSNLLFKANAVSLWVVGDDVFYLVPEQDNLYTLYRAHLSLPYRIPILANVYGPLELHEGKFFYYDSANQQTRLMVCRTDGSDNKPLPAM